MIIAFCTGAQEQQTKNNLVLTSRKAYVKIMNVKSELYKNDYGTVK
jgi:hypothetical protein